MGGIDGAVGVAESDSEGGTGMAQIPDLKELESRAWKSFFQDGLWDVFFGGLMLALAAGVALDNAGVPAGWRLCTYAVMLLLPLVLVLGKRTITVPRMGSAAFGAARRARAGGARLVVGAAVVVTGLVLLAVLAGRAPGTGPSLPVVGNARNIAPGLMAAAVLCLVAWFHQFARLYFYALLMGGGMTLIEVNGSPWLMLAGGCLALAVGLTLLVRFVRAYPRPEEEDYGQG
jgi:hypothetical protein